MSQVLDTTGLKYLWNKIVGSFVTNEQAANLVSGELSGNQVTLNYYTGERFAYVPTVNYHDSTKQDLLTAGDNITIKNNVISSTASGGTTYTAGSNIAISSSNVISATNTTYSAGTGLALSGTTFKSNPSYMMARGANTQASIGSTPTKVPLTIYVLKNGTDFTLTGGAIKCNFTGIVRACGSVYINAKDSDAYAVGCYIKTGTSSAAATNEINAATSAVVATASDTIINVSPILMSVTSSTYVGLFGRALSDTALCDSSNCATYLLLERVL